MKTGKIALLMPIGGMILFWAITPITIAYVKTDFSLFFQVWLRYLSSSVVLWLYILTKQELRASLKSFSQSLKFFTGRMLVTALCTVSFQLLYTFCFFLIEPAFGILLYQSQALFSLLIGALFISSERKVLHSRSTIAAIIMAVSGASAIILFQTNGIGFSLNAGVIMALLAAISWAFVGLTNRIWLADRLPPIVTVTIVFSMVSVILTPAAFIAGNAVTGNPDALKWIILIGSGLLGVAGGQGLFYYLIPRLGLIITASVQLLVPFLTGILSFIIFGEEINLYQIVGGIVLLSGCWIIIRNKTKLTA